jgi:hypothetical protein
MGAVAVRIELIFTDLAAQGIAVDAKDFRRARLVAVGAVQDALDKALFEFPDRLVKKNASLHHLIDEPFQLIFHDDTLRSEDFSVKGRLANPVRGR